MMTTKETFVDSVDQDQTKRCAVWSLMYFFHIFILEYQ